MFAPVQRLWTDSKLTRRPDALWKLQPLVLLSCYRRWQLQARRLSNQQSLHHKRCFHKHQDTLPKQTTVVDIRTIHRSGTVAASCMSSMLAYTTLQKCTFRGTKHTMGLPAPNKVHCSTHTVHAGGGAKLCQRYLWNCHSDCQFPRARCCCRQGPQLLKGLACRLILSQLLWLFARKLHHRLLLQGPPYPFLVLGLTQPACCRLAADLVHQGTGHAPSLQPYHQQRLHFLFHHATVCTRAPDGRGCCCCCCLIATTNDGTKQGPRQLLVGRSCVGAPGCLQL